MKNHFRRAWTVLAFSFSVALLVGCGGSGGANSVISTTPPPAPIDTPLPVAPPVGRFAYVANASDDTLSIYAVNASTGQLRHNGYVQTPASPHGVAVHPSGKFVYVANWGAASVSAYAVQAGTGGLSSVGVAAAGVWPFAVTIDPSGRFAYVANEASASISAYRINAATGALTEIDQNGADAGTTVPTQRDPRSLSIDPTGRFAYVANAASHTISAYSIHQTTGALTEVDQNGAAAGNALAVGIGPQSVTVHPSGKFAYVANKTVNAVSAFSINSTTGALTALGLRDAGTSPTSVVVDASGQFAYAANEGSGNVSAYTINTTTGVLSAGTLVTAGDNPSHVSVDPSGKFAYVTLAGVNANAVQAFSINAISGALTATGQTSTRRGPLSLAMSQGTAAVKYTPKFAYVVSVLGSVLGNPIAYRINPATGALALVAASASTGGILTSVATDPTGRFAYVTRALLIESPGQVTVESFNINSATGALTGTGNPALMRSNPQSSVVDPSGRFVLVANSEGSLSAYTADAITGALTSASLSSYFDGSIPRSVSVDPSGRFAYMVSEGSNTLRAYSINANNGVLTEIDLNGATAGLALNLPDLAQSVEVDPTGRFAYVTVGSTAELLAYRINPANGALSSPRAATTGGSVPSALAISPDGRFAYTTNSGSNTVAVFSLDPANGMPTNLSLNVATGPGPSDITLDASGQFAYVTSGGSSDLQVYSVNATTGALTAAGAVTPTGRSPTGIAMTVTID